MTINVSESLVHWRQKLYWKRWEEIVYILLTAEIESKTVKLCRKSVYSESPHLTKKWPYFINQVFWIEDTDPQSLDCSGFPKEAFQKTRKKTHNSSLVGTQIFFVAQCSLCFGQNFGMQSKFKSEKNKNHIKPHLLLFSVLNLAVCRKIKIQLYSISTFSAAQIKDADLKCGLIKP